MFTNCVKLHLLKSIKYRPLFKWNMSQKLNTNELRIYFLNVMVAISYDIEFGRVFFFIWQAFDIICINVISKWVKDLLNQERRFDYRKKVFCNALNIFPMFVFLVSFNYQNLFYLSKHSVSNVEKVYVYFHLRLFNWTLSLFHIQKNPIILINVTLKQLIMTIK